MTKISPTQKRFALNPDALDEADAKAIAFRIRAHQRALAPTLTIAGITSFDGHRVNVQSENPDFDGFWSLDSAAKDVYLGESVDAERLYLMLRRLADLMVVLEETGADFEQYSDELFFDVPKVWAEVQDRIRLKNAARAQEAQ